MNTSMLSSRGPPPSGDEHKREPLSLQKPDSGKNTRGTKLHCCLYCEKLYTKMARHLEQKHADEFDVAKVVVLATKSNERRIAWSVLVNKGDYNHNYNVIDKGTGCVIPKYRARTTQSSDVDCYIPCEFCLAMHVKADLWRHQRSCSLNPKSNDSKAIGKAKRSAPAATGKLLLPTKTKTRDVYANVVLPMKNDDVKSTVEMDPLIMAYGARLYEKYGNETHNRNYISNKLRELTRLILSIRKITGNNVNLDYCITPCNWEVLLQGVREVAGYDTRTCKYAIPSLPLKLGGSLSKCAKLLRATALVESNDERIQMAQRFLELHESDWSERISAKSHSTLRDRQYNKPRLLPLIEDIVTMTTFLTKHIRERMSALSNDVAAYAELVQLTLAQVILFNRKRSGEAERMRLADYQTAISANVEPSTEVEASLSKFEVHLCKTHMRIETKGKGGRRVPVLLTQDMLAAVRVSVAKRELAGVCSQFLFGRPGDSASRTEATIVCGGTRRNVAPNIQN